MNYLSLTGEPNKDQEIEGRIHGEGKSKVNEPKKKTLENKERKGKKKEAEPSPYIWNRTYKNPDKFENAIFRESFGPVDNTCASPIRSFSLFLEDEILEHTSIVEQSNLFATQKQSSLDLTLDELKCFLGILIIMGFHRLPSIRMYWSSDPNFHVERISNLMTVKRFLKILRFLHVNDPNFDKLYKIRPLSDYISDKCKTNFQPSRHL